MAEFCTFKYFNCLAFWWQHVTFFLLLYPDKISTYRSSPCGVITRCSSSLPKKSRRATKRSNVGTLCRFKHVISYSPSHLDMEQTLSAPRDECLVFRETRRPHVPRKTKSEALEKKKKKKGSASHESNPGAHLQSITQQAKVINN